MRSSGSMTRRGLLVLALCLSGLAVMRLAAASPSGAVSLPTIPLQMGRWEGQDQAVDERSKGLLGTDQVVVREYRNGEGATIWLAVVYAAENRSAFHPPELCYTGSNFELLEQNTAVIARDDRQAGIEVNRLLMAHMTDRQQQLVAYYWFTAGDRLFTQYHRQQIRLLWNQLRWRPSGGTLVRISTPVDDRGVEAAERRLAELAALLMGVMQTEGSARAS